VLWRDDTRALVITGEALDRLVDARPGLAHGVVAIAREQANRLRAVSRTEAESMERALDHERRHTNVGRFVFMVIVTYALYTWVLGTATQAKEALGHSEYVTIPTMIVCVAALVAFMKRSGYPPSFFGLTLHHWRRNVVEAVAFTLPLMLLAVLIKAWMVSHLDSMQGEPIFQVLHHSYVDHVFNPWLIAGYLTFVPLQELVYRGGLQGALEHFFSGPWRGWAAIFTSNIIFSSGHLYISLGLSVAALLAGFFWGWLYRRQRSLVGVALSHVLLGLWVFEVVDLGPLE
jgi:membrane protease YdiL (CAAX protease family)